MRCCTHPNVFSLMAAEKNQRTLAVSGGLDPHSNEGTKRLAVVSRHPPGSLTQYGSAISTTHHHA
jgi:hypothetical protein